MEANDLFDEAKARENYSTIPRAIRVAAQVFALAAPLFCALFWNHVQKFEERIAGRAAQANVGANLRYESSEERRPQQDAWRAQLDALYPDEKNSENLEKDALYSALLENDDIDFNAFIPDEDGESNLEAFADDEALVDAAPFDAQNDDVNASAYEPSLDLNASADANASLPEPATTQALEPTPTLATTLASNENEGENILSTPITEEEVFGVLDSVGVPAETNLAPNDQQTSASNDLSDATSLDDELRQDNSSFVFADPTATPLQNDPESLPLAPGQVPEFDERVPAPGAASVLIQPQQEPSALVDETNLAVNNTIANESIVDPLGANESLGPQTSTLDAGETDNANASSANDALGATTDDSTTLVDAQPTPKGADASTAEPETQTGATAQELEKIALLAEPGAAAPSYFSRAASLFGGAGAFSTYYFARTVDLVGEDLLFSPKSFSGAYEELNVASGTKEPENEVGQEPENAVGANENDKATEAPATSETPSAPDAISQASYAGREPGTGYIARDDATTRASNAVLTPADAGSAALSPIPTSAAASSSVVPTATPTPNSGATASLAPGATTELAAPAISQDSEYVKRLQAELRAEGIVSARVERWDATNWRASGVIASGASGGAEFLQGFGATARDATEQLRARRAASLTGDVRR